MHNRILGSYGEDLAIKYLVEKGYRILNRNFYTYKGEIDIIAKINKLIVFIEVKTRTSKKFGKPVESVNLSKINHLILAGNYYVFKNNLQNREIRFDVIEISIEGSRAIINHIKNILF